LDALTLRFVVVPRSKVSQNKQPMTI